MQVTVPGSSVEPDESHSGLSVHLTEGTENVINPESLGGDFSESPEAGDSVLTAKSILYGHRVQNGAGAGGGGRWGAGGAQRGRRSSGARGLRSPLGFGRRPAPDGGAAGAAVGADRGCCRAGSGGGVRLLSPRLRGKGHLAHLRQGLLWSTPLPRVLDPTSNQPQPISLQEIANVSLTSQKVAVVHIRIWSQRFPGHPDVAVLKSEVPFGLVSSVYTLTLILVKVECVVLYDVI